MAHKHRVILNNRNAIFSLCEASCEAQFKPDVTSFFVGWCIYEKISGVFCPAPAKNKLRQNFAKVAKIRLELISQSNGSIGCPLGFVIDRLNTSASLNRIAPCLLLANQNADSVYNV